MEDYYVYEWYNSKTNEIFYVGKGRGYRYKAIKGRNQYFTNYYNKYRDFCEVRKTFENLNENDAYAKEIEFISKYREVGMCKCNLDTGGLGGNEKIFENGYHKKLYYDTLRISKKGTNFELSEIEELVLCDIVENIFGMVDYMDIHRLIFKTMTTSEIMKVAENYCEQCDSIEHENIFISNLIKEGAYGSYDDYWEHIYKF